MVVKVITSNQAVAEAVKLSKPKVVPVYPITPQTTISEYLAQYVADGDLDAEYIRVESEHSAISASIGASGAGVRVFTATSSQGLMLMHEIVYAAAGMRLPIVMADANRAISSPINIWNDQQDSIAQRDAGWIQLYCENAQESLDTIIQAYRIAENEDVLLPTMVCLDGFYLTHTVEPTEIPESDKVDSFVGEYVPKYSFLNPNEPKSLGTLADPEYYMEARYEIDEALNNSLKVISDVGKEFGEIFGREYGLIDPYKCEDAEYVLIAMGSICTTLRSVVNEYREKGEKIGLLKIRAYRPFPVEAIKEALSGVKRVGIIDKNISLGVGGALYNDILAKLDINAYNFIVGLGGRDITPKDMDEIVEKTKNPVKDITWIGLKED
ncbi:pyruvate synthase subunit PorA [Methanobrevibacter curvatus]|uniref:Pyruvate synthase subunit PorA n=1 Tax=Methanobrevibacter curvatus TaxID=49547 RepID=A0A166A5S8_9EURY|nr:pyruvate synthase subunit PorA [Methanobrevibacter curvatus]KZX11611.1 pyruvate synthase subunit PorA [Methanobrevibacter curvatus]